MENSFDHRLMEDIKYALKYNNHALAVAKIQEYLDREHNTPLNIAVTGEGGSGKSTFVNAFRGIDNRDERAAPTGCVETTSEVTSYPHPNYPNVTLWDLPGIGATNFSAKNYIKQVGFEKSDFFIIISGIRIQEYDVLLVQEIQKMKKKFFFVCLIDHILQHEKRSQRKFNAERTLKQIRNNCIQGLQTHGVVSPQVFLVSSKHLQLYDFPLLWNTLERELAAHKRNALLLPITKISLEVINKKKKAFHAQIKYYALLSLGVAAVPVPGLSLGVDLGMLLFVAIEYTLEFGLDTPSLQRLSDISHVPLNDLIAVTGSQLAIVKMIPGLVLKVLWGLGTSVLMAVEEEARLIPKFVIPVTMSLSCITTYRALSTFLNIFAEDAQRVFKRALGLNTSL